MGLSVTFVSGLRRSGKSALIAQMIERLWRHQPHYIRMTKKGFGKPTPKTSPPQPDQDCGVATARWLSYDEERVFEILPEALQRIHQEDRFGSVVIEADADPTLRHAYPYDNRVFVMPTPSHAHHIFRDPACAADELRRALDDTAAFASEMFGLFADMSDDDPSEERPELTPAHMRGFLYSPLGDELATRIQLQPAYHGLVESDVIVVNNKVGDAGPETADCIRRIEQLIERFRVACGRTSELFLCDPCSESGRAQKRLYDALSPMCAGGS